MFEKEIHHLGQIFGEEPSLLSTTFTLLGKPLAIYNIEKLVSIYGHINHISLPSEVPGVARLIEQSFPYMQIDEFEDIPQSSSEKSFSLPLDAYVSVSSDGGFVVNPLAYPWDIMNAVNHILETDVRSSRVSKDASIADTTIIQGPCIIEEGVTIDDFCKIKGPVYISSDSKIGHGSLIRSSMIGKECKIGFTCEIGKSYLAAKDTIPHLDVILDSIIAQNVWMGAYVGTTNVMLNNRNVKYEVDGKLIDTGLQHFGGVIEHDATIGAGVLLLPGRRVPSRVVVPPGIVYSSADKMTPNQMLPGQKH